MTKTVSLISISGMSPQTLNTTKTALLAPLEIWEVSLDDATIKFHQPLVLTPTWMADDPDEPSNDEYLQIICPELNIDVWGKDRDDLLEAVMMDIRFVWNHIVLEADEKLDAPSKIIKRNHLAIAEAVDG